MFFVAIEHVKPGDVVARAIYDGREMPLVAAGSALSAYEIERLTALGFRGVYIDNEMKPVAEGAKGIISEKVRSEAEKRLGDAFSSLQQGGGLSTVPLQHSIEAMLDDLLGSQAVVTSLTSLRTHDTYTFAHSVNVAAVSLMLGEELGLDKDRLRILGLGALLHDVGKTSLSPTILRKPGGLTDVEYRNVKEHPRLGYDILKESRDLDPAVARIAWQHHERVDGKGYPRGLRSRGIDPLAKIVAVADVYDALTADRVYRKGMPTATVLDILQRDADSAFDPAVVQAILRRVAPYPVGTVVRLNSGQVATVVSVSPDAPLRPAVKSYVDPQGNLLGRPAVLDLRRERTLAVEEVLPVS